MKIDFSRLTELPADHPARQTDPKVKKPAGLKLIGVNDYTAHLLARDEFVSMEIWPHSTDPSCLWARDTTWTLSRFQVTLHDPDERRGIDAIDQKTAAREASRLYRGRRPSCSELPFKIPDEREVEALHRELGHWTDRDWGLDRTHHLLGYAMAGDFSALMEIVERRAEVARREEAELAAGECI